MANPLIPQGTLNRARGSIIFASFPQLNITAPFLGPEGINMTPEGPIVENIGTLTGTVTSPALYQMMSVEVQLLKTQSFSDLFKKQLEQLALLGNFTVRPDAPTLSNYLIYNSSIIQASAGRLNGTTVPFMITLQGFYPVNNQIFDQA